MSPEAWSRRLRHTLLEHLWGQWSALGVAGYGAADGRIIDPEALLLCSLDQARHDARLFDAILDWCRVNGSLLAIPRLKALRTRHPAARPLAALAELDPALPRYAAVAAYLHERAGDPVTAARCYADAARLAPSLPERDHLTRQVARLNALRR